MIRRLCLLTPSGSLVRESGRAVPLAPCELGTRLELHFEQGSGSVARDDSQALPAHPFGVARAGALRRLRLLVNRKLCSHHD